MRIALLTQDDGIFSYQFIKPFLEAISENEGYSITSVNLSRSTAVGKKESNKEKFIRVKNTFGWSFVISSAWRYVTNKMFCRSVAEAATQYNIPTFEIVRSVNTASFRERLQSEKVDVVVIVAGTEIIKKQTLDTPPFGFINCHSSLLPSDKGLMPVFWSLLSERTGFTWYKLNEGIDTGSVLLQQKVERQSSFVNQLIWTKKQAASRLIEAIEINAGNEKSVELEGYPDSYNKFPTNADIQTLKRKIRLV